MLRKHTCLNLTHSKGEIAMKFFEDPKMELIKLDVEDVITTSGTKDPDEGDEDPV